MEIIVKFNGYWYSINAELQNYLSSSIRFIVDADNVITIDNLDIIYCENDMYLLSPFYIPNAKFETIIEKYGIREK